MRNAIVQGEVALRRRPRDAIAADRTAPLRCSACTVEPADRTNVVRHGGAFPFFLLHAPRLLLPAVSEAEPPAVDPELFYGSWDWRFLFLLWLSTVIFDSIIGDRRIVSVNAGLSGFWPASVKLYLEDLWLPRAKPAIAAAAAMRSTQSAAAGSGAN